MHTPEISPLMELLPFYHLDGGVTRKILVLPDEDAKDRFDENGILVPTGVGNTVQMGTVVAVCQGSIAKVGDRVAYMPIRPQEANPLIVVIDGTTYHHIIEQEIWDVNDTPVNKLHVVPYSGKLVTDEGIIEPPSHHGLLQYATVHVAPKNSKFKPGDTVGYRLPQMGGYPTATIDKTTFEIIPERDVMVVNGKVSPKRIIVKIDTVAQRKHQSKDENGILLHPNFIHMQRMLQYARVKEVGEETAAMYPGLAPGDYVAIHHTVEHQSTRIVGVHRSSSGNPIAEYRTINCQNAIDNEIFAKLIVGVVPGRPNEIEIKRIEPYGDLYFFEWGFDMLNPHKETLSDGSVQLIKEEFDVSKFRDLERLRIYIDGVKKSAVEQYKVPHSQYVAKLQRLNPEIQEQKNERDFYEGKIEELKRSADALGKKVGYNFPLSCKIVAPKEDGYTHVVTTYKELYPIQILGKRYLIGYKHFILGYLKSSNNNMSQLQKFVPFGSRVLVKALEEKQQSEILLPHDMIQEVPEKGTVISVGQGDNNVNMLTKPGDTVWFRKGSGVPIKLDGEEYLIFRQNEDLMGFITE